MDINFGARRVAANVAAHTSAYPLTTVAQAADMREKYLKARLNGDTAFTVNDLVRVGGFFCVCRRPDSWKDCTHADEARVLDPRAR